uniref:Uncharacterized protein n=1 Tax=Malurus cyaneus samueli TaxID=2593467 RepID=A0A8C5TAJ3_9PASS
CAGAVASAQWRAIHPVFGRVLCHFPSSLPLFERMLASPGTVQRPSLLFALVRTRLSENPHRDFPSLSMNFWGGRKSLGENPPGESKGQGWTGLLRNWGMKDSPALAGVQRIDL